MGSLSPLTAGTVIFVELQRQLSLNTFTYMSGGDAAGLATPVCRFVRYFSLQSSESISKNGPFNSRCDCYGRVLKTRRAGLNNTGVILTEFCQRTILVGRNLRNLLAPFSDNSLAPEPVLVQRVAFNVQYVSTEHTVIKRPRQDKTSKGRNGTRCPYTCDLFFFFTVLFVIGIHGRTQALMSVCLSFLKSRPSQMLMLIVVFRG